MTPIIIYCMKTALKTLIQACEVVENSLTDEKKVNISLFYIRFLTPCSKSIERMYDNIFQQPIPIDTLQLKVKNVTKTLLKLIEDNVFDKCAHKYNNLEYRQIDKIDRMSSLIVAREHFNLRSYDTFDFDEYRKIRSVSRIEDLDEINLKTKQVLLRYQVINSLDCIADAIANALNRADIISSPRGAKVFPNVNPRNYAEVFKNFWTYCALDYSSYNEYCTNREELLKQYCPQNCIEKVQKILTDVYESLGIKSISKRDISAVIYVLFEKRRKIGFTRGTPTTFAEFQRVICQYYQIAIPAYKYCKIKDRVSYYTSLPIWLTYNI